MAQSAVRGDHEGLEARDPSRAGVVPDVDVGLRGPCAVGAAVEGHHCCVRGESRGEQGEEGGLGVHCCCCGLRFGVEVCMRFWRSRLKYLLRVEAREHSFIDVRGVTTESALT